MSPAPTDRLLFDDLMHGSRDAAYRAMCFIARHGGPRILGSPDDYANLMAQRETMRAWIEGHPEPALLENDYRQFRTEWSPIYKD